MHLGLEKRRVIEGRSADGGEAGHDIAAEEDAGAAIGAEGAENGVTAIADGLVFLIFTVNLNGIGSE
jgi:hypothetical protein